MEIPELDRLKIDMYDVCIGRGGGETYVRHLRAYCRSHSDDDIWSHNGVVRLVENPGSEANEGRRKVLVYVPTNEVIKSYAALERKLYGHGWERYYDDPELLQFHKHSTVHLISLPKDFKSFKSMHMYDIVVKNRNLFEITKRTYHNVIPRWDAIAAGLGSLRRRRWRAVGKDDERDVEILMEKIYDEEEREKEPKEEDEGKGKKDTIRIEEEEEEERGGHHVNWKRIPRKRRGTAGGHHVDNSVCPGLNLLGIDVRSTRVSFQHDGPNQNVQSSSPRF
ncbi:hypothetical protein H6P81_016116 [Aristolochia fimbriata]|uniref:Flowering-promoting factor 1-like protein 3 n=1 Tax=Aristolochia fimbriata TaxID=158543 RepID=A0AAV7EAA4_ARIFI|nr:hypothetical protein H6P81_016116 [Aristolochia fimbriata]